MSSRHPGPGPGHEQEHEHHHGHEHAAHTHGDHDHPHAHPHRARVLRWLASAAPHRHDPADAIGDTLDSDARGIRAVKVSLVALGLTALAQLALVAVSGSVALFADTIHNASDALTAIPLWIAFALGSRAATRRYTFGFRRAEDLAGLVVLLVILASALLAGYESISRLVRPVAITGIPVVVAAGVIGFAGNEAVALYRMRVGRSIGSAALVADGYHARADGLTSLAVVIGAIGVWLGYPAADPLVGLAISGVILVVLLQAARQVLGRLMDAVEPETTEAVERLVRTTPGVQDLGGVRVRWVGHALEATLEITVDRDLAVGEGHAIAEAVRHRLLHEVPRLEGAVIHVNPCSHDGDDPHAALRHHDARREAAAPEGRGVPLDHALAAGMGHRP